MTTAQQVTSVPFTFRLATHPKNAGKSLPSGRPDTAVLTVAYGEAADIAFNKYTSDYRDHNARPYMLVKSRRQFGTLRAAVAALAREREVAPATPAAPTVTAEQHHILRHALGTTRGAAEYRNHFCTGPGSTDYPHCEALVAAGLMTKRQGNPLSGGEPIYSVTAAGREVAAQSEPTN